MVLLLPTYIVDHPQLSRSLLLLSYQFWISRATIQINNNCIEKITNMHFSEVFMYWKYIIVDSTWQIFVCLSRNQNLIFFWFASWNFIFKDFVPECEEIGKENKELDAVLLSLLRQLLVSSFFPVTTKYNTVSTTTTALQRRQEGPLGEISFPMFCHIVRRWLMIPTLKRIIMSTENGFLSQCVYGTRPTIDHFLFVVPTPTSTSYYM